MRPDFALVRRMTMLAREGRALGRSSRMWAGMALAAVACVSFTGCTTAQTSGQSSSYFIITNLSAAPGATPDKFSNTLASDVVTNGSVFEDKGKVELVLALKNPGSADSPNAPTTTNFITITRYHVAYVRSDGRNTQGVDVPYAFDGGATATVSTDGAVLNLVLVRVQAKEESPLRPLRGLGGAVAISTIAEVTLYGTDQAGREVSGTGRIGITFADWGDPQDDTK